MDDPSKTVPNLLHSHQNLYGGISTSLQKTKNPPFSKAPYESISDQEGSFKHDSVRKIPTAEDLDEYCLWLYSIYEDSMTKESTFKDRTLL